MVRLQYLDTFKTFRTTPPVIMPEIKGDRKKRYVYMVWAPSIEKELIYLTSNIYIKYNNIHRYFIPKRWQGTVYGKGNQILQFNKNGEISELLEKYKSAPNLKNIANVVSYLPSNTARPMKGYNVLVEQNYLFEIFLNNEKDRRIPSNKFKDTLNALIKDFQNYKPGSPTNLIGSEYTQGCILIPLELWFTHDELMHPEKIIRQNSKNFMGWFFYQLGTQKLLNEFFPIVLQYQNMIIKLDSNTIPSDVKNVREFLSDTIHNFVKRIKNIGYARDQEGKEDEARLQDETDVSLAVAEKKTQEDMAVDLVAEKTKVDPDAIPEKAKDQIKESLKSRPTDPNKPEGTIDLKSIEDNNINLSQSDQDILMKAKLEGRSFESEKRNELLRNKYKDLKIGSTPIAEVEEVEKKYEIPPVKVKANTINPALKDIKPFEFEKSYNKNLAQYDLVNILRHFSGVKPPLYLNKDIKIEDASTPMERVWKYTVEFEDENRKRHRFSFLMPKMYKEKYLYLNDQEFNISHQKFPYPITKVSPNKCQLVTNYNKIFTERYGTNLSPRVTKIKKVLGGAECPSTIKVEHGDSTIPNRPYLTTVEQDDLGSTFIKIQMTNREYNLNLYFIVDEAKAVTMAEAPKKIEVISYDGNGVETKSESTDDTLLPIGYKKFKSNKKTVYYFISGKTNIVYDQFGKTQGELSDFVVEESILADNRLEKQFADTSAGSKFIYARSTIMAEDIPTILVVSAADPNGLIGVLEKGKIKYQFMDHRPKVNKDVTGVIPFEDGYLVYDRYPYENSLLLNGLLIIPTKEWSFYAMADRDTYVDIFDTMFNRRNLIDAMQNFYALMVDPITKDILNRLDMPTDFTRLMLYCVGTLADNSFQIDSAYYNTRIRSNEIINAYLYKELATAWEQWRIGRIEKFSIRERAIIDQLLTVQTVDPHSKLNMTLEAENNSLIKLKGPSGMNEDHSFTLEKRAYHPSMRGIIAMNTTPSGEVGIGRHLTLNANVDDARGFVNIEKPEYDGTELASAGELLQTFGPESADIERVAMAISQSKHLVPVASQTSGLVNYDMERTIPYLSNDFAFRAKQDGKVVEIKDDIMIIQYKDGTYDDIDLSRHPDKNVDGGFFIMNQMQSDLKVGNTFRANDIIAFDPKYINSNDMFGDPCADVGCLGHIVIETNGAVYEDSGYCTDEFAHRMATKITRQKRVILSQYANIKKIAKVGDKIKANDPILIFDDTSEEFSSQLLASIADQEEDSDDAVLATGAPVISKIAGTISDIFIYYTIPLEDMTPSMRKIVEEYDRKAKTRSKTLAKYISPNDSNTIVKPAEQLTPDSQGKVKGVPVGDGVIIDFYIEYDDILATGDKSSSFSALKTTYSFVIPAGLAPYTDFNPERKIDMALACVGMYKRMCLDIIKVGGITKYLIEMKRLHKNKYLDRIKNELKK